MAAFPDSTAPDASGREPIDHDVLIEQLHRIRRELTEMLALAVQTPAGDSHDAAMSCLHAEADALARKFLSLSENLLGSADDPAGPIKA
jgi:hypothetical protein